jgi:hypothetical protein
MTLGSAGAAHFTLIVWCRDHRHEVEPNLAQMAEHCGVETTVPDWAKRLVCGQCGRRKVNFVVSRANHDPLCR